MLSIGKSSILQSRSSQRRGAILVLTAIMLIAVLAFAAFSVDVGFILLTKSQLQNACDSAALGSAQDLKQGLTAGISSSAAESSARQSGVSLAGLHSTGDRSSVYVNSSRDIRFGQAQWDSTTQTWRKAWGATPYNLVEVTAHRDSSGVGGAADGPLSLFFGPAIGHTQASLSVKSTAMISVGVGVRKPAQIQAASGSSNYRVDVLPIAVDEDSWNNLLTTMTPDVWKYDEATGTRTAGSDGVPEINIYPTATSQLPSGNRGTVDLGSPNNSTNDLKRQILNGLNDYDLSFFPGSELSFANGPLMLNGDTGLSAGIESTLQAILGQPRLIPIFRSVSGNGNNARYEIIKFVGVRLMYAELSGSPSNKKVIAQPCAFSSAAVIRGIGPITRDSYFALPSLMN